MIFNVLIVDDEKLSRSYIRNMLQRQSVAEMNISEASSAREALQAFEANDMDIIFLDIKMPGMDGFAFLESIPHRNFELIFITAYNQYAIKAIKENAADYLLKPVNKVEFATTLEKVLKKCAAKRTQTTSSARIMQELRDAEYRLTSYMSNVKEKNEEISRLNKEIDRLITSSKVTAEKGILLDSLLKKTILTEDDWSSFKEIFESVYPAFFHQLRERHTGLTQAEQRLMALIKLNMATKEMANLLGISPETIRQTRWRLRKKINLDDETSLEQLAAGI